MAKQPTYGDELAKLGKYILSEDNENAKNQYLYPIFSKLFGEKMKTESAAGGADVYVEGQIIVECKTKHSQWVEAFFQALHYKRKAGLAYHTIIVIAHEFVAIWKNVELTEDITKHIYTIEVSKSASQVGKENAKKINKQQIEAIQQKAIYWLSPKDFKEDSKSITIATYEILKILNNLKSDRIQINTHNFIEAIETMKGFFERPIDAVHAFYSILPYWDFTSKIASRDVSYDDVRVIGFNCSKFSEKIDIIPRLVIQFESFIIRHYIFTNEGSGLSIDYYFSRFDEVLATIDPEFVEQHGIFFTDHNLSKFTLWYLKQHLDTDLSENYYVFDPAGGSGNLVASWRGHLKHKIISELQPDLLKIIERRLRVDPFHVETGFTVVPKPAENRGLNFIKLSADEYLDEIEKALAKKEFSLDKPLAFLLNPPYKNTDENEEIREVKDAEYEIHPDILNITGEDAGRERYLAFLGQILLMAQKKSAFESLVLIFTPTSWLIPRPTFQNFRTEWDKHFEYQNGLIVTSNEFFKLDGKWPVAFTVWKYKYDENRVNEIQLTDFTHLKKRDLNIDWDEKPNDIDALMGDRIINPNRIRLTNKRGDIRETLPKIQRREDWIQQPRYDYSTAKNANDYEKLVSGFPKKDKERHFKLKRKCGNPKGEFIGFYDDNTPVRVFQDTCNRMTNQPDRVWFRLDNVFININQTRTLSGAPDKYGFCAYDLDTAKTTFSWFTITKALNGKYPLWANQYDIWKPEIKPELADAWYSLCFAFVLAENRCVVTKFEKNNPVENAPEVFVDNPLAPRNKESFWYKTIKPNLQNTDSQADKLIKTIEDFYLHWNMTYIKGEMFLRNVNLENEPYFKYFDYADFLTPHSGLIQIRKYAEINEKSELIDKLDEINDLKRIVLDEAYRMLVEDFGYFR